MGIDKKEQVASVLDVQNLSISYADGFTLQPLSFAINGGETLAVVGESGSGKTTLARAVVNFFNCLGGGHPKKSGEVFIDGIEVLHKVEKDIREYRMLKFSVVYQNSSSLLNPSLTLAEQLWEVLKKKYTKKESIKISIDLMEQVGLCEDDLKLYPGQISGGMAQRFMIAMSISLKPKLVVLDEPTSSIDVNARDNFIRLIKNLQKETGISFLLITHDLLLAKELAVKMLVLYRGYTVEFGNADEIIENPTHPYTAGLIRASMDLNPLRDIWGIRSAKIFESGCPFFGRCTQSLDKCSESVPALMSTFNYRKIRCHRGGIITALEGRNISKSFGGKSVLRNVDIKLHSGEVVAIVGKTGCGKTTLSSILSGFLESDTGEVLFEGRHADFKSLHKRVGGMQIIFQDSENALNPRLTVMEAVCEPLVLSGNVETMEETFLKAMQDVGLYCGEDLAKRKIGNLSGGQKQRVNIARALVMEPNVIIADEPTSMLDASSKANLLRTLKGIQNSRGCALLIVTHDMVSARKISDKIYNLCSGTIENKVN